MLNNNALAVHHATALIPSSCVYHDLKMEDLVGTAVRVTAQRHRADEWAHHHSVGASAGGWRCMLRPHTTQLCLEPLTWRLPC